MGLSPYCTLVILVALAVGGGMGWIVGHPDLGFFFGLAVGLATGPLTDDWWDAR